jgi:serine/threonine protein kinase
MAPEVIKKENAGFPSDVWSLGVLLYVILVGTYPFKAENDKDLYRKIEKGYYTMPEALPAGAKNLLKKMLAVEPIRRPTCNQILGDPWIAAGSFYAPAGNIGICRTTVPMAQRIRKKHSSENIRMDVDVIQ